jgi:hypothetical protein
MAGTVEGALKAAATNMALHGDDFYHRIGKKGGTISRGGGFASSHELAVRAGRKGGTISRRGPSKKTLAKRGQIKSEVAPKPRKIEVEYIED